LDDLNKRIQDLNDIRKLIQAISDYEHGSPHVLFEFDKAMKLTFIEIILCLKKSLELQGSTKEFEYKGEYLDHLFWGTFEMDDESCKLMGLNLGVLLELNQKEWRSMYLDSAIKMIRDKYDSELTPLFDKYGERVFTDYGHAMIED
jgi:hypothetical protein